MTNKFSILGLCLLLTAAFSVDASAESLQNLNSSSSIDTSDSIEKNGRRPGRRVRRGTPRRTVRRGIPRRTVRRGIPPRRTVRRTIPRRTVRRTIPRRDIRRPIPGRRIGVPVAACRVGLLTYRNYVSARFVGQARGFNALNRACREATIKCQNYKRRTYSTGRCVRI